MPDIMLRLGREVLVLDGAMGTMLQRAGLPAGECPELLNVTAPDMVAQVHQLFQLAGSDCASTNTFGGSRPKLAKHGLGDRVEELNRAGVRIAKRHGSPHVLADVGPTGLVLEPLGPTGFEELFEVFREQIAALAAEAPDAIYMETFTDIAEVRCAVLAARDVCDLPVFASVTCGLSGRMDLSGTDPASAAVILEAAGVDMVGLNCGLGPEQMVPLLEKMAAATRLPLVVQPNAGMPRLDDAGETVFPGTPVEMGEAATRFMEIGAAAVGSCCGSTPAFTADIAASVAGEPVPERPDPPSGLAVAGPRRVVRIGVGQPLRVIGERINPTGKEELARSLREGATSVARALAAEQEAVGADLLDVNVGAAGINESAVLVQAVAALSGTAEAPLVLDSTDAEALEAALRVYPGRALVNSVSGETASLERVLPLVARYGAAVIVLALDETGIPEKSADRVEIVERVQAAARANGLGDDDLLVDGLVLTAATSGEAPRVTLETVRAVESRGLATVLGISNVSHGLPERALLNAAFLTAAAASGLDAAIANPNDSAVMGAVELVNQVRGAGARGDAHEDALEAWQAALDVALATAAAADGPYSARASVERLVETDSPRESDPSERLVSAVLRGDAEAAPGLVDDVVAAGTAPQDLIGAVLTPAIQRLGDAYGRGEVFLPQMMVAADAMKAAVRQAKTYLPDSAQGSQGRVAFATVKGDIHAIGKDICVSLLESQGFEVANLGVDVSVDEILSAAEEADVVCLSALMTTTLRAMSETIEALGEARPDLPVLVGGAVVTAEWAASVGAGYAADAPGCVTAVREAVRSA